MRRAGVIFLTAALLVFVTQNLFAKAFPYAGDISAGVMGGDNEWDSYAELMLPLAGNETSFLFLSPRLSMTAKSVLESYANEFNAGIGYRKYFDGFLKEGFIAGVNLYYDNRNTDIGKNYQQIGAGMEFLSDRTDFRLNFYFPVGNTDHFLDKSYNVFENHNIAATYYYELAARGFDCEIGFKMPLPQAAGELRVFGGYYNFEAEVISKKYCGFKARAEYKPLTALSFNACLYQDEILTGSAWQAGAALSLPFDFRKFLQVKNPFAGFKQYISKRTKNVKERIGENIVRDMRIRVYKEAHKRFDDVVCDEDDHPYHFTVVTPDGHGNGTFANPANAADGAALSKEVEANTAVLLFLEGHYFHDAAIDLSGHKAKNVLITGPAELAYRNVDISAISEGNPVIAAAPGITLFTLAGVSSESIEITTIEFEGSGKTGIGFEVSGCDADIYFGNNSFTGFETGIKIINSASSVYGYNNIISSNATGVHITGGGAVFEQNIFSYNSAQAVLIDGGDDAYIISNLIDSNETGIKLKGSLNSYVLYNELTNNNAYGVLSSSSIYVLIDSNLISSNVSGGIYSRGDTEITISQNDIMSNFSDGISVSDSLGALIAANVIGSNGGCGIYVSEYGYGAISDNIVSLNSGAGIKVDGAELSEVSYNEISSNGTFGIDVNSASGLWIISNGVSLNEDSGIRLTSSDYAVIDGNTLTHNKGHGMYLSGADDIDITSNFVSTNTLHGIFLQNVSGAYIEDNGSYENENGIHMINVSASYVIDNKFSDNLYDGIYASALSASVIINNKFEDNGRNGGQFDNISDAYFEDNVFAFSKNSGAVFNGVYSSTFTDNRVTENEAGGIILTNSANSSVYRNVIDRNKENGIFCENGTNTVIESNNIYYNELAGISITGGNTSSAGNILYANGEGIRAVNAQSVILSNNEISSSAAGGIYISNVNVSTVSNNLVYENGGYGGIYASSLTDMTMENNYVINNSTTGITLVSISNSTIRDNDVNDNAGNGIYIDTLVNSLLLNNSARRNIGYGMVLRNGSDVELRYNGFFYNDTGGGLNIVNSANVFLNTNIFQSYAPSAFYGLYLLNTTTFNANSGGNQFMNSNYYGHSEAMINYQTDVEPKDFFY